MNTPPSDFLDWEVLPGSHTAVDGENVPQLFSEGDWLAYHDGHLVGRIVECASQWDASTEGDLPHKTIGRFSTLTQARSALENSVREKLNTGNFW